ncbi:hypothetical protein M9Y10_001319 [Tritrichomonas musculus]|uniref:Leucine Rich Repeat family protein n=1 Tax=Tritrichomonas musculus TaxID=1915356 RepID=A0ABR2L717_9EUKA
MIEAEDYWDFEIFSSEELKEASEMKNPKQRGNLKIEGIFIGDEESDYLVDVTGNLDPKNILFNKCKFQFSSFDGTFCGPYGVESVTILNSNLTSTLANGLLGCVASESFKSLNSSHNNLGENANEFFSYFKSLISYFCCIKYIDLSDNGFKEEEIKKFAKDILVIKPNLVLVI